MDDLKIIFASNLIAIRKQCGMSQLELGEKLNYSDKTISKWERAEGLPDVITLKAISEIFNVTTDWLLAPHDNEWVPPVEHINVKNIIHISVLGIWTAAILAFVILWIMDIKYWLIFAFALPLTFITLLVLNSVFYQGKNNMWITHGLLLSVFAVIYLVFYYGQHVDLWPLVFVAVPCHIIVFLSFHIKKRRKAAK